MVAGQNKKAQGRDMRDSKDRDHRLGIRVQAEEAAMVREMSRAMGLDASSWIRMTIREKFAAFKTVRQPPTPKH